MARFEIRMEALPLYEEEVKVLREKAAKYRREKNAYSHQQILKNVAKHALSLTPPRDYSATKSPEVTPGHMVPIDGPSSCLPRKVVYNNPQKSSAKTKASKKEKAEQKMQVTKIGVMSTPKPLSPINTEPAPAHSPLSYKEWKMRHTKSLPKIWKQTDVPPAPLSDRSFDDSEDEELIELPESLTEREAMVQAAQKTNDHNERPKKLIPVGHSKSFEKWPLHVTPSSTSASSPASSSTKSPSSSASSTLPPPSPFPVNELSSSASYNSTTSSTQAPSPLKSLNSSSNESIADEAAAANHSPPCLIVPKTINALSANNIGQVYITDKISDLDKLVMATAFSPVPVSTMKPKFAGKSKSDFAIHHGMSVTFIKKSKEETAAAAASKKFPPDRNIDVCKQYEIVKAARFPNTWIDEMEAIAVIIFLLAVIGLLLYRSAYAVVTAAAAV